MARYHQGINGDFSGKVGAVVGSQWNGVSYIRGKSKKNPNRKTTPAQEEQQARFGLAAHLVRKMTGLFSLSYQKVRGLSGTNQALQNIVSKAVGGIFPNLVIDYSKVLMAKGSLNGAHDPAVVSSAIGELKFTWLNNTGLGNARSEDQVILVAFCEEMDETINGFLPIDRSAEEATLPVKFFSGKPVHTWISFISSNGKQVADSIYTGVVNVL